MKTFILETVSKMKGRTENQQYSYVSPEGHREVIRRQTNLEVFAN
jgi:hypothetical protein